MNHTHAHTYPDPDPENDPDLSDLENGAPDDSDFIDDPPEDEFGDLNDDEDDD